jgi:photosystem II stability/assembly factor-like uncharacterized protein
VLGAPGLFATDATGWLRRPTRTLATLTGGAVAADGSWALLVGQGGMLIRYDFLTGSLVRVGAATGADLNAVRFRDDGTAFIVGNDGTVILYDPVLYDPALPYPPTP